MAFEPKTNFKLLLIYHVVIKLQPKVKLLLASKLEREEFKIRLISQSLVYIKKLW